MPDGHLDDVTLPAENVNEKLGHLQEILQQHAACNSETTRGIFSIQRDGYGRISDHAGINTGPLLQSSAAGS